jgi:hypothetical protein
MGRDVADILAVVLRFLDEEWVCVKDGFSRFSLFSILPDRETGNFELCAYDGF